MTTRSAPPPPGTVTLDVALLGRDYKVACKEEERAELTAAVGLLESRLQEIRAGGKTGSAERIAVMAALNLAHDLLREKAAPGSSGATRGTGSPIDLDGARRRIAAMHAAIDRALSDAGAAR